jgi:serine/threonine protein kinase
LAGPPIKEAQTPVFAYAKPGRDLSESRFQQNRDDLAAESSLLAGLHSKKIPHLMAMTPVYKRHKDAPVLKGTVMPFYECGTVRQYLQFHPNSVSAKERLAIAKDVAEALEGLHQLNVIHSDLKPENIFLVKTAQGFQTGFQAVVGDFGLSLDATQSFSGWQGTRAYMAPEMVDNLGKQWKPTPALDMWALGLFFVELFYETTRTNFLNMLDSKGDNRFEQLRNKVVSRVSGPTPLNKLIVDLLSMQPGDRPSAARVASILTFLLKN